jgi:hypothetical protein
MLAKVGSPESKHGLLTVISLILKEKGVKGLFAGTNFQLGTTLNLS